MTFRLLITGSRAWSDYNRVYATIAGYFAEHEDLVVIAGDAGGADAMAVRAAKSMGLGYETWDAHWKECDANCRHPAGRYCPQAGFRRNAAMVAAGVDACEAFELPCQKPTCKNKPPHPSHGTMDCVKRVQAAGVIPHTNHPE